MGRYLHILIFIHNIQIHLRSERDETYSYELKLEHTCFPACLNTRYRRSMEDRSER